jgi:hypothetical protein
VKSGKTAFRERVALWQRKPIVGEFRRGVQECRAAVAGAKVFDCLYRIDF